MDTLIKGFILLWLCTLILSSPINLSAQESYNKEIYFSYSKYEYDDKDESKTLGAGANIYFSDVDTSDHPLAEAAFLERIGSVDLLIGKSDASWASGSGLNGPLYGALLTYMKPHLPIAAQIIYIKMDFDLDPPLDGDRMYDLIGASLGYFFRDNLLVALEYSHSEMDTTIPSLAYNNTVDFDDYNIWTKLVKKLDDGKAINLEGDLGFGKEDNGANDYSNTIVGIAGDYYFNRQVSVGAGLELNSGDDKSEEGQTLTARFTVFMDPTFSIHADFNKFSADNSGVADFDGWGIDFTKRF